MNNLTPFSGLSLVVHLLIIGIVGVFRFFARHWKKLNLRKIHFFSLPSYLRLRPFKISIAFFFPAISVFIICMVAGVVLFSTTMAVKTGIREGTSEPSRRFINNQYAFVHSLARDIVTSDFLSKTAVAESTVTRNEDAFTISGYGNKDSNSKSLFVNPYFDYSLLIIRP